MARALVVLLVVLLLACLAGVAGLVCTGIAFAPAVTGPTAAATATVPVSPQAAQDFDRKVEEAQATRTPGTRELVLTQEEITSRLQEGLGGASTPVRNLQVRLEPGTIQATGTVDLGLVAPQVRMRIQVAVQDNVMSGRVEQIDLGGIPLPAGLQNQLLTQALAVAGISVPPGTDLTDLSVIRPPADLRTLRVEPGRIVLELRAP